MQKLSGEHLLPPNQLRPRRRRLLTPICAVVLALAIGSFLFFTIHTSEPEDTPTGTPPEPTAPEPGTDERPTTPFSPSISQTERTLPDTFATPDDLASYIGRWCDASLNPLDPADVPSTELVIYAVEGDTVTFRLTTLSPQAQVAELDCASGTVKEGTLSFTFSDDGWGNAGSGQLRFEENRVSVIAGVLEPAPDARWGLTADLTLRRFDTQPVDVSELLHQPFLEHSYLFGNLPSRRENAAHQHPYYDYIYAFEGVTVSTQQTGGELIDYLPGPPTYSDAYEQTRTVYIDYAALSDKTRYTYRGLDGNSTYQSVLAALGQPRSDTVEDGNRTLSYSDGSEIDLTLTFDESDRLISLLILG